jgi:transposase
MKKHSYRSDSVKAINVKALREELRGRRVVVGTDVAKRKFVAVLMTEDQQVVCTIRWEHPTETPMLIELLKSLDAKIEVVMESTGNYGVAFQYAIREVGIPIYQIGTKRVHDAGEVYDGVPSKHDPKDAAIIAKLHLDGLSKLWKESSEEERTLVAAVDIMNVFQEQKLRYVSRLESLLAVYWPELPRLLELGSPMMVELILRFGTPKEVSKRADEVRGMMKTKCNPPGWDKKIDQVIESARKSQGVAPVAGELEALQLLVGELKEARCKYGKRLRVVEELGEKNEVICAISKVTGKKTAAVLVAELGDPREYSSAKAFQKAAGYNLTERSSGEHKGKLKISKRGSPMVRKYEYFTAMRFVFRDEIARAWYCRKVERDGGVKMKAMVAIMRKLHRALWYVARGDAFDSKKLFDIRRLGIVMN